MVSSGMWPHLQSTSDGIEGDLCRLNCWSRQGLLLYWWSCDLSRLGCGPFSVFTQFCSSAIGLESFIFARLKCQVTIFDYQTKKDLDMDQIHFYWSKFGPSPPRSSREPCVSGGQPGSDLEQEALYKTTSSLPPRTAKKLTSIAQRLQILAKLNEHSGIVLLLLLSAISLP